MNALIYVRRSGMPLRVLSRRRPRRSGVKETDSELTFVSFGYKRNGFASFATKRRIKSSLQKYSYLFFVQQVKGNTRVCAHWLLQLPGGHMGPPLQYLIKFINNPG